MKIFRNILLVTLLAVVSLSVYAHHKAFSMEFAVPNPNVGVATGFIYDDTYLKVSEFIVENNIRTLYLRSPGGKLSGGYNLGNLFSRLPFLNVAIYEDDECASACAFAFLGAKKQHLNGKLSFHMGHLDKDAVLDKPRFQAGQGAGSFMLFYILKHGYSATLAYGIVSYTNKDTYLVLNTEDLGKLYIGGEDKPLSEFLVAAMPDFWLQKRIEKVEVKKEKIQ